jgi:hypothetical protein
MQYSSKWYKVPDRSDEQEQIAAWRPSPGDHNLECTKIQWPTHPNTFSPPHLPPRRNTHIVAKPALSSVMAVL